MAKHAAFEAVAQKPRRRFKGIVITLVSVLCVLGVLFAAAGIFMWKYLDYDYDSTIQHMTDEQLAQRIESAEYLYDMMAIHKNNTDNVTIEMKKGSILQMTMKDQDMANSYVLSIEEGLKQIGFKEVTSEVVPVTLADAELYGVKTVATYEKTTIHQLTVPWRRGNYIATITIMALKEETVDAIKDAFFPVKVS